MILLTPEVREALRANDIARRSARREGLPEPDPVPLVKLFNPLGAATWLATELDEDGDTLFGLADLGFGCPELGCFSLSEIAAIRLPFGLRIERDLGFEGLVPLSDWADWARGRSFGLIRCCAVPRAMGKRPAPPPSFRQAAVEAPAARFAAIPTARSAILERTADRRSQGARL